MSLDHCGADVTAGHQQAAADRLSPTAVSPTAVSPAAVSPAAVLSGRREDLDEIAERYARDRLRLPPAEAQRLRDQIITAMLPFAGRMARRYRSSREPAEDLEQVARLGLVKAVDRYDPERGSYTAFAVATISGELKRHFRDYTWGVHVPRRLQDLTIAVTHAENALTAELRRRPTDLEVAQRCRVGVQDVADARQSGAGYRAVSLSLPVGESSGVLGDLLGTPDHAVDAVADNITLRRLIDQLPPRDRRILVERFYGNRTQSEIAADLGISQMHVSRLLSSALTWLRAAMLSDGPPPRPRTDGTEAAAEQEPLVAVHVRRPGVIRVRVTGEVDRDNADSLRRELLGMVRRARAGLHLEIDLHGVPLLDAAGVAVLLGVHEAARVRGVDVTAVGLQPFVRRIATVSGLGPLLRPEAS